ncbi:MAG TPA: peptidoglycan-binding protein, partial [Wenzhouxiangellaceae bacterium]|nr:peptidoglycan-binding protein [Wenzhouxiangellaceae bacterium]
DNVLARQSGQDFQVPIPQLDARWLGDFYAVWPDMGSVWQAGDDDAAIAQLKRLAAQDPDQPWLGAVDARYGPDFQRWIRGFQLRNGLRQDGMAGPVTRLFLSTLGAGSAGAEANDSPD